ncbi:peptidylprolyl isomerase [Pelagerythrobacter marinus]|uniref:peptidylprolyl isomerase n=1 Tax=Pelagerythrobacter marinus TaxID=538382 RepID=UPI0020372355|nr:peptidylprolyl isomerase [Pelagerythrobacter marinus]USA38552.1 peptidylprolyl isomerase [Pelagerythrobacter marinus]WPZ07423.1 peptidylprolyl isomerase [Pelagerythrobacter marinus]
MKTAAIALGAAALALALPVAAQDAAQNGAEPPPGPGGIVAAADPAEWIAIAPEDLLVMTLAPGADGAERKVVIQLMPPPFSQGWVENIRTLARAGWYDGIAVTRVQDNYVVQWGDPHAEDEAKAKPLPDGLRVMGAQEFEVDGLVADFPPPAYTPTAFTDLTGEEPDEEQDEADQVFQELTQALDRRGAMEAERAAAVDASLAAMSVSPDGPGSPQEKIAMISIETTSTPRAPEGWHQRDSYAQWTEIWHGWPLANRSVVQWFDHEDNEVPDPMLARHEARKLGLYQVVEESWFWPVHCYGMVGVGRGYSPDTGSGAELYTVIGHAPRHLDRNIALVGRVVEGIEHLSSLPRGTGPLGFYEDPAQHVPIRSIRVASDLPEAERPRFEYLASESETFARYAEARANRRDPFFIVPAGGADVCNIPVPVRRVAEDG